jgi:hypothetical protein
MMYELRFRGYSDDVVQLTINHYDISTNLTKTLFDDEFSPGDDFRIDDLFDVVVEFHDTKGWVLGVGGIDEERSDRIMEDYVVDLRVRDVGDYSPTLSVKCNHVMTVAGIFGGAETKFRAELRNLDIGSTRDVDDIVAVAKKAGLL